MTQAPSYTVSAAGNALADICHAASFNAGWWRDPKTGVDLRQEARDGARKSLPDDKLPHRSMIEVELADAIIRIGDLAGALGLDLGGAIAEKMAFNAVRPDHKAENRTAEGGKAY
jgi:hypothetical protein